MKLIRVIKARREEDALRWGPMLRADIAKDVANNFNDITGIDINKLFTKIDDKYGTTIENVNAELFDKQIPKIYKWVKNKYHLDKDTYDYMSNDSDFIDFITDELTDLVDMDKVEYDKSN